MYNAFSSMAVPKPASKEMNEVVFRNQHSFELPLSFFTLSALLVPSFLPFF